jgi:hypothetical protein
VTSTRGRCAGSAPRRARRRIALLGLRLLLGDRLLEVLETKLQLIRAQLLRPLAELLMQQALDQQPQLVVLGMQLAHHLLQDRRVVRNGFSVDRHDHIDAGRRRVGARDYCSR